jgi:hypothetical protein
MAESEQPASELSDDGASTAENDSARPSWWVRNSPLRAPSSADFISIVAESDFSVQTAADLLSVPACRRSSEPQVVTAQLIDGPAAHQLHIAFDFGSEIFKRPFNAGLTCGR